LAEGVTHANVLILPFLEKFFLRAKRAFVRLAPSPLKMEPVGGEDRIMFG
jgi:hypothetical protein